MIGLLPAVWGHLLGRTVPHPEPGERWEALFPTTVGRQYYVDDAPEGFDEPEARWLTGIVQRLEIVVCRVTFDMVEYQWVPRDLSELSDGVDGYCWSGQLVERVWMMSEQDYIRGSKAMARPLAQHCAGRIVA